MREKVNFEFSKSKSEIGFTFRLENIEKIHQF